MVCGWGRRVAATEPLGGVSTVLEIQMGMVDRGADLSVLSQYPHEKDSRAEREGSHRPFSPPI